MAKIEKIQEVAIEDLILYERNAKLHPADQVQKIADSIQRFGFISPVLIDFRGNVIAGHGRIEAAKLLGMKKVPCVEISHLSNDERRAYILTDNRLSELGEWDAGLVSFELKALNDLDFDIDLTGFELESDWFEERERFDNKDDGNESEEYQDFVEKFEPKKTTDDCYTPDLVYEAVANWVAKEYKVKREDMIRPFYPGGDYQNETYPKGCVVVDNPPFSIESEILRWYAEHGVKFFLFASGLTLFSIAASETCAAIPVNVSVTYENKATVSTSFYTNLEPEDVRVRTAPSLYKAVQKANDEVQASMHTEQRKYSYPNEVITAPMLGRYSKYGVDFIVKRSESVRISALDMQKETDDAIFGGGFLIAEKAAAEKAAAEKAAAEKAAAEKAAAEKWLLSEREVEIVKSLGK